MVVVSPQRLHDLKKRGPTACSLFLDQIMKSGSGDFHFGGESDQTVDGRRRGGFFATSSTNNPNWNEVLRSKMGGGSSSGSGGGGSSSSHEERVLSNVRLSQVNNTNCSWSEWNWDLVTAVFKWPSNAFKQMESDYRTFILRVVYFFQPSSEQFCKIELSNNRARYLAITGCYFLDFLLQAQSVSYESNFSRG